MKRHTFDYLSFVTGFLATAIGLAFLLPADPTDIFQIVDDFGAWFWPTVLVLVGVAILAPLAVKSTEPGRKAAGEEES